MSAELFSEEYYDYRTGQARDIEAATRPFVFASVERRDEAETRASDTEISIQKMRYGIGVRYITIDSDPAYRRLHRFAFGYGDGDYLAYLTQRINSLLYPEDFNSTEAIAGDDAALSELAWVAKAIMSSDLAKRRQYPEEQLHQPPPPEFDARN